MKEFEWRSFSVVVGREVHKKGKAENWLKVANTLEELAKKDSIHINHFRIYDVSRTHKQLQFQIILCKQNQILMKL